MNTIQSPNLIVEIPAYATLQREMHDALLVQHPDWIERNGNCPKCDEYDRRFAQLLSLSLNFEHAHAH